MHLKSMLKEEFERVFDYAKKGVSRMSEKKETKEKKEFVEPQLIKSEEPLDKVTMEVGPYGQIC